MLDNRIDKFDILPPLEAEIDIVDSMSAPRITEYVSAQHALLKDCAKLQVIDGDIAECRMLIVHACVQMRILERERSVVQRCVSIHRARLSLLRALPDEVLQDIFKRCLPDSGYVVPDICSAPLVLTRVCRRWRTVVQGTSELWSSIALHDRGVWNYELEVEMARKWLSRSRTRPIRMCITCPPHTDFGLDGSIFYSDIFRLVTAHSSQLRDLCLDVNRTYLHHFMNRAILPALQSIRISLHSDRRIDELLESDTSASISATNLRHIVFKGIGMSINIIPRTIFPQITHLSFDCDMTLDLALLFQDFPNLHHLTIKLSLSRDALRVRLPPQKDHRMVVPALLSFEVCLDQDMLDFGDPASLEALFDQLELPALKELAIVAQLTRKYRERTGYLDTSWGNHMAWVDSPSVPSLLARSQYSRPRFVYRNLVSLDRVDAWR